MAEQRRLLHPTDPGHPAYEGTQHIARRLRPKPAVSDESAADADRQPTPAAAPEAED